MYIYCFHPFFWVCQMEYDGVKQLSEDDGGFRINLWRPVTGVCVSVSVCV